MVSQIIQVRKVACTDIHPFLLLFSLCPPPTHTPSSVLRIHLQIEQIYHSVKRGQGREPGCGMPWRWDAAGMSAMLPTVSRCACSPHVAMIRAAAPAGLLAIPVLRAPEPT